MLAARLRSRLAATPSELFDNELDAARAYDKAVWRLKPAEAKAYVNFKVRCRCPPSKATPVAGGCSRDGMMSWRWPANQLRQRIGCSDAARDATVCRDV